ncbi:hypothetical protein, partial [Daejeonella sp.]|uniref:hypothetical protein n=1 Tax=Daejeonella sp. TaxID=2805397 RepID=UPI0037BE944F
MHKLFILTKIKPTNPNPMESIKRPSAITLGHDLAFLYLNLGYITDGELSQEEIEKIVEKVEEWYQPT